MRFLKLAMRREKRKPLSVAFTESEREHLKTAAMAAGMSLTGYIRESALHYSILEGIFENLLVVMHGESGAEETWEHVASEDDEFEEKMKARVEAAAELYRKKKGGEDD